MPSIRGGVEPPPAKNKSTFCRQDVKNSQHARNNFLLKPFFCNVNLCFCSQESKLSISEHSGSIGICIKKSQSLAPLKSRVFLTLSLREDYWCGGRGPGVSVVFWRPYKHFLLLPIHLIFPLGLKCGAFSLLQIFSSDV